MKKTLHNIAAYLAVCVASIIIIFAAFATIIHAASLPPVSGTIVDKAYYPAYYPVDGSTPWNRELVIMSEDGMSLCTWEVNEEVYNLYEIGDPVQRWQMKEVEQ